MGTPSNYAWAAIDMALWDLCGKSAELPVYKLLGGAIRPDVDYFYYLTHGTIADVAEQCAEGMARGYETYYLKTGIDLEHELDMVATIRKSIGPKNRIRLDSNGAWSLQDAPRYLGQFEKYDIDFIEQPVREHPMSLMIDLRTKTSIPLAANEGLWSEEDANRLIMNRVADVYTFSPFWVGTLAKFKQVAYGQQSLSPYSRRDGNCSNGFPSRKSDNSQLSYGKSTNCSTYGRRHFGEADTYCYLA